MAEHGEWISKGASLSDVTATKEYGVSRDFILKGIRAGKVQYREGAVWGNPYRKLLRRELEQYIAEELGADHLQWIKNQAELRKITKEMATVRKRLDELQARKSALENSIRKQWITEPGARPMRKERIAGGRCPIPLYTTHMT